jgi:hypothetical protein
MRIGKDAPRLRSLLSFGFSPVLLSTIVLASVAVVGCGAEEEDVERECSEDFDCQGNGFTEASCNEDGVCVDYSSGCDETQCHAGCTNGCDLEDAGDVAGGDGDSGAIDPVYPRCDSDSICQERSTSEYCYEGVCIDCLGPCYGDGPCSCSNFGDTSESDAGDADAADARLDPAAVGCESSGGTVSTASCCGSSEPFPDLCAVGACGCADEDSVELVVCDCGEGRCFDGTTCVDSM